MHKTGLEKWAGIHYCIWYWFGVCATLPSYIVTLGACPSGWAGALYRSSYIVAMLECNRQNFIHGQNLARIGPTWDPRLSYLKWSSRKVWEKWFRGENTIERLGGSLSKVIAAGDWVQLMRGPWNAVIKSEEGTWSAVEMDRNYELVKDWSS